MPLESSLGRKSLNILEFVFEMITWKYYLESQTTRGISNKKPKDSKSRTLSVFKPGSFFRERTDSSPTRAWEIQVQSCFNTTRSIILHYPTNDLRRRL